MAVENLNLLNIVNAVLIGLRDGEVTSLTNTRTKQVLQAIKEIYLEVCSMSSGRLKFLEADGTITLIESTRSYDLEDDCGDPSLNSWVLDNDKELFYLAYDKFKEDYIDITEEGTPYNFTLMNGVALIGYVPNSNYAGKIITYKYWKQPDDLTLTTDYPLIPKEFRRRILVSGAKALIKKDDGNPNWKVDWDIHAEGVNDLKKRYGSTVPLSLKVRTY